MWDTIMTTAIMSSEESGYDEEEEVLFVHPLPWRSAKVDHFFSTLDKKGMETKSPQARRQMKKRVQGSVSVHNIPLDHCLPKWAINTPN